MGLILFEILEKWELGAASFDILGLDDVISTGVFKFLACSLI